ncbi:hypothetical protein UFOVP99_19 [uncultured Caudovirales phage]|uniref:Uncharacterized protein n=1 Tax=uncultured Caudovirales phage TaxID=2100421 RepID=A0A6J5L4V8_9CAUD|nr:hypothetical protein UFOVP99_19 [uncultured Caudovirales phage]
MTGVFDVLPAMFASIAAESGAVAGGAVAGTAATSTAVAGSVAAAEAAAAGGAIAAESGGLISAGTAAGVGAGLAPEGAGLFATAGAALGSLAADAAPYISAASAAMGGVQKVMAGNSAAAALRAQAAQAQFNVKQELLRGETEAQKVQQDLLTALAQQRARYGASGLDLGFGAPVEVGARTIGAAERSASMIEDNAGLASEGQKVAAASATAGANAAQTAGYVGAVTSLFDYASRRSNSFPGASIR